MNGLTVSRRATLGGMGICLSETFAMGADAPSGGAAQKGLSLHLEGKTLRTPNGPIVLTGVCMGDVVLNRSRRDIRDYELLRDRWGANAVRLSVHPGYWLANPMTYWTAISREVSLARKARLYVVLDWHAIGWPDGPAFIPKSNWGMRFDSYRTDMAAARDFWSQASSEFAHDRGIVFELWNEPMNRARPPDAISWNVLAVRWIELISIIRRRAENIVIVSGTEFARSLKGVRMRPISDAQVAYGWHPYTLNGSLDNTLALGDLVWRELPVMVTEWAPKSEDYRGLQGTVNTNIFGQYVKPLGKLFVDNRIHSFAWCFNPGDAMALVQDDWVTPTYWGALVRQFIAESRAS